MNNLPRMPGAILLVGYPPSNLLVTVNNKTRKLQEDAQGDALISPSMSADGSVVASAHRISGDPFTRAPRLMVSTYSMADDKWTDHKELVHLPKSFPFLKTFRAVAAALGAAAG